MPLGPFKPPQAGPKIGKTLDFKELPKNKQEEIGDFSTISPSDPILASHTDTPPNETREPDAPPVEPPPLPDDTAAKIEQGVENLEALHRVIDREQDPIDAEAAPTETDKLEYMRCILGNRLYKKRFELFGGTVVIELRDLSPSEEDDLFAALSQTPPDDWNVMVERMRLMLCITRLQLPGQPPYEADAASPKVEWLKPFIDRFKSATVYRAAMHVARVFHRHLEVMLEMAGNSDFWKVDGSSLPQEPTQAVPSTTDDHQ